ncbi:MAG: PAS-domain containing protein [Paracoccaceae bacterium]
MIGMSLEAENLGQVMQNSPVAFSCFDSSDRLTLWNRAYEDLNIRIRPLIRRGALFSDLLSELILRGQIRIPNGQRESWIQERLRARRHGVTAFRTLADGRTFLAQERKDEAGATLGFWLDVSDLFQAGALKGAEDALLYQSNDPSDPGCQDMLRSKLQTVLMTLEYLASNPANTPDRKVIDDAISATETMGACLDIVRAPVDRFSSGF